MSLKSYLQVIEGPKKRIVFALDDSLMIGRSRDCQIRLRDPKMSRHHLRLVRTGGCFAAVDMGSPNGTKVNGKPLKPKSSHPLQQADVIEIGGTRFYYFMEEDVKYRGKKSMPDPYETQISMKKSILIRRPGVSGVKAVDDDDTDATQSGQG